MINVLGIVPARAGSKGIKNKNISLIDGKPLICYTLEAALGSKHIKDIIVSTDSDKVISISRTYGINVESKRPENLSDDKALTIDVINYEIEKLGDSIENYSHIMLLQPTCPLRTASHIDKSIEELVNQNGRSLISVVDVSGTHPLRMKVIRGNQLFNYVDTGIEDMRPRQDLPQVFIRNGAIYLADINDVINYQTLSRAPCIPFVMSKDNSVNIDHQMDLILAEYFINQNKRIS